GTSHRFQRTSPTPLRGPGLFSGSEGIDCARGLALPAVAGPSLSVDCVELRGLTSASHSTLSTSSRTLWEQVIAFKEQARPPYGDRACSAEAKGLTARGASRSPLWRGRLSQWTASSCADFGPLRHRLRALRVEPYGYKPSLNAEAPSPIGSGASAEAKGLTARGASRSPLWRGRLSQWTASSCADFGPLRHRLRALRVEPYGYKPSLNAEAPSPIGSGASAEAKGFEPLEACTSPVFKTGAFDHSATLPRADVAEIFRLVKGAGRKTSGGCLRDRSGGDLLLVREPWFASAEGL